MRLRAPATNDAMPRVGIATFERETIQVIVALSHPGHTNEQSVSFEREDARFLLPNLRGGTA